VKISFREVKLDDAQMILRWRTCPRVTRFMNTDIEYDIEAQKRWLSNCYTKRHYYHWIIESDNNPIGLINILNYDLLEKNLGWGFYVGEENYKGIGGFVPPFLYNFCFKSLGVKQICAEVFFNNVSMVKLCLMHGYFFTPAGDRVITKNGKDILLISMKLEKDDFLKSKFYRFSADFPTERWTGRPDHFEQATKLVNNS